MALKQILTRFGHQNFPQQQSRVLANIQQCCYKSTNSTNILLDGDKEDNSLVLADQQKSERIERLKTSFINVDKPNRLSELAGEPDEHVLNRRVRIYKPAKNAMQSGTFDIKNWKLDYETRERWENPLMGWTSTGDPKSNLSLSFITKEDAIAYCERNGYYYEVDETHERRKLRKTYAENFSWNKRTRLGSK